MMRGVIVEEKTMKDVTFQVYRSLSLLLNQRYRWRLVHLNDNILAMSSEGYGTISEATEIGNKVCSGYYWSEGS